MNLDTFLFYLLDAIAGIGTILTAAAVIVSHVVVFALWKTTYGGPHRRPPPLPPRTRTALRTSSWAVLAFAEV